MRSFLISTYLLLTSTLAVFAQIPDNASSHYSIPKDLKSDIDYLPGQLVVKLKSTTNFNSPLLQKIFLDYQIQTPISFFPQARKPIKEFDQLGRKLIDLTPIYSLYFPTNLSIYEVSDLLNKTQLFEYVQPKFIFDPLRDNAINYTPNDASFSTQWYLKKIKAPEAWNTHLGDSTHTIAIIDGGQNWVNPDLQNYLINYADTVDGIDNDNDGYIDNIVGWNTGDNNYDITAYCGNCIHGTSVAGVAAAKSDNTVGVAGVAFNTKFTPIKIANSSGQWVGGESGIFYATEKGLKILNCSWGSTFYNPVLNDVVQYAAINKSCLLVASAGNGTPTAQAKYYPAALENVLCVSGTDSFDVKLGTTTSGSSFYKEVDITAPAFSIFTTYGNGFSNVGNGTSYSAPMVSAAASLLYTGLPGLTTLQIDAILKQKSFNNTTLAANLPYSGKIGKGRLDIDAALNAVSYGPYFHFNQRTYYSNNGFQFFQGDTVQLRGLMFNVLENSSPITRGILRTTSPHITLVDSIFQMGSIPIYGGVNNNISPYTFRVNPTCPPNTIIEFQWVWEDGIYTNVQHFSLIVNRQYIDITTNNVNSSLGFNGRWGFMDEDDLVGLGMQNDQGFQHMLAGSFMIGKNASAVSDASFSAAVVPFDSDFQTTVATTSNMSPLGLFTAQGSYNDNGAGANAIGVEITHRAEAINEINKENFIILHYEIANNNTDTLKNIFAGLNAYWNILNEQYFDYTNISKLDSARNMGYAYNPSGNSKYAGIRLLSNDPLTHYAFNFNGAGGSINMSNGFTSAEKWDALSGATSRNISLAGTVTSLVGTGPLEIQPNGIYKIAFALVLGDDLSSLQTNADYALLEYQNQWNHWTGSLDNNWHNSGNWSKNSVPDSTQKAHIHFTTNQPIVQNFAVCLDIIIDSAAIISVQNGAALKVKDQSINKGKIQTFNNGQFIQGLSSNYTGNGIFKASHLYNVNSDIFFGISKREEDLFNLANGINGGINPNAFAISDSLTVIPTACQQLNLAANSPNSNIWTYRQSTATPCNSNGYLVRTMGKASMAGGLKIKVLSGDSIIQVGTPFNQELSQNITQNISVAKNGHLLSNPYPSNIHLNKFLQSNPNIQGGAAIINEGNQLRLVQNYSNPYIKNNQAFWTQADSSLTTISITYNNEMRKSGLDIDTLAKTAFTSAYKVEFLSPSNFSSEVLLVHDLTSSTIIDNQKDLIFTHPSYTYPAIGMVNISDSVRYSLNAIPNIQNGMDFPLYLFSNESGTFNLKGTKLGTGNNNLWALFYNHNTNSYSNAEDGSTNILAMNQPNAQNMVSLRFCSKPSITSIAGNCTGTSHKIQITNNCQLPLNIALIDSTGDTTQTQTSANSLIEMVGLQSGTYTIHYGIAGYQYSSSIQVLANNPVIASFTAPNSGYINTPISFTSTSVGQTSQIWHFGDGMLSTLANPVHTYINEGIYTVQLISSNNQCNDTATQEIQIITFGLENENQSNLHIYMNGEMVIVDLVGKNDKYRMQLLDMSGKIIWTKEQELIQGKNSIEVGKLARGVYVLQLQSKQNQHSKKLIIGF